MAVAVYPLAFYTSIHWAGVAIGSVVSLASAPLASGLLERIVEYRRLSRWWMLAAALGGTGAERGDRHPKIGKGVLLGAGAKVLGNIRVGNCSRIAAGSVVLADVPRNSTVAGVPARVVGEAGCSHPSILMDQMIEGE